MRALLVVNHRATTTSGRSRDVLVRALGSAVDLTVAHTRHRGHGAALAAEAAAAGDPLVVVHGGDGTVNEVVNGLMAAGTDAASRPALAVVPGGSTNVFARALGLPGDWAEATGVILEALREGRTRTIGLGLADDRYFTFCAGFGLDAAVVRRVEQARWRGRPSSPVLYAQATVGQLLVGGRPAGTDLAAPGVSATGLGSVIVQNTAPWTYLWNRPLDPNPSASFDRGLDVLAVRSGGPVGAASVLVRLIAGRRLPTDGRWVSRWEDLSELVLTSPRPQPLQLDGEYVGERETVTMRACPQALRVVC